MERDDGHGLPDDLLDLAVVAGAALEVHLLARAHEEILHLRIVEARVCCSPPNPSSPSRSGGPNFSSSPVAKDSCGLAPGAPALPVGPLEALGTFLLPNCGRVAPLLP